MKKLVALILVFFFVQPIAMAKERFLIDITTKIAKSEYSCETIFLRQVNDSWEISKSMDLLDPAIERVFVCLGSRIIGGGIDVLHVWKSSANNCILDSSGQYARSAPRSRGYHDCNSEFAMGGIIGKAYQGRVNESKLEAAMQSPAVKAATPAILKKIYDGIYAKALGGDIGSIQMMLEKLYRFVSDEDYRTLLVMYGRKTGSKEFPKVLLMNAKPEIVSAVTEEIRQYWIGLYRRDVSNYLSPGADGANIKRTIDLLSAENKDKWNQEDFDNALPKLVTALDVYEKEAARQAELSKKEAARQDELSKKEAARQAELDRKHQAEEDARLREQIAQFRRTIKVGALTNCGQVYDVRKPMIGVQTMIGQQYIDLSRLFPDNFGCHFRNGTYVGTSSN